MKIVIKERYPLSSAHIPIGVVFINFESGELTGDEELVTRITEFTDINAKDAALNKFLGNKGADMIKSDPHIYSEHSQSPSYELKKPFHDISEFKALLSCMGWHSDELADIDMPESTWVKYPDDHPEDGVEIVN